MPYISSAGQSEQSDLSNLYSLELSNSCQGETFLDLLV